MDVSVLAVGKLKAGPERELCDRFLDRARKSGRPLGFRGFEVREALESRAPRTADRTSQEADAIFRLIPEPAELFCLDASGDLLDSGAFASRLERLADDGSAGAAFVIGGADGLAPGLKARARGLISFGRVTWPHQIARILLAEQLYRAMTILSGHPYHRA